MKKNKVTDADCIFEKKKWISVTGLCNNNCMFCLDGGRPDKFHRNPKQIKKEIKEAKEQGNTKLILSGGDPTIHPDIIDFVKCAKELGYSKIQIITNGRMFTSKEFTNKIIEAGLDEVTFSIHGYNSKMHDSLTNVPGSFIQIINGVKNVFNNSKKMIVNTDTCITKNNYEHLPKIIRFIVEKVGITEVNLMSMVPEGNAWKHKSDILYDYGKVAPYVHKVINYCIKKEVVLWLSRFPAEYLEGYEEFIEDPYKLVDDVRGRIDILKDTVKPICKGEKCIYCCLNKICEDLIKINLPDLKTNCNKNYDKEIIITNENYKEIPQLINTKGRILLKLVQPSKRLSEYKKIVPKISDILPFLKKVNVHSLNLSGIPKCLLEKAGINALKCIDAEEIDYSKYIKNNKKDYLGLAEELATNLKIKRNSCKICLLYDKCPGIYLNYVRIFGFNELTPIKDKTDLK